MKKGKPSTVASGKQEEVDLAIEISFLEGLRARLPLDGDVLKLLGDAYTKVGRYQEGLQVDKQLATLLPEDALVHYNLACSLSLVGKLKEAASVLHQAITLGYSEWNWLLEDPDLEALRKSPEFEVIARLLRQKRIA